MIFKKWVFYSILSLHHGSSKTSAHVKKPNVISCQFLISVISTAHSIFVLLQTVVPIRRVGESNCVPVLSGNRRRCWAYRVQIQTSSDERLICSVLLTFIRNSQWGETHSPPTTSSSSLWISVPCCSKALLHFPWSWQCVVSEGSGECRRRSSTAPSALLSALVPSFFFFFFSSTTLIPFFINKSSSSTVSICSFRYNIAFSSWHGWALHIKRHAVIWQLHDVQLLGY